MSIKRLDLQRSDRKRNATVRWFLPHDFVDQFSVITRMAVQAEKIDLHAQWLGVYNRLHIWSKARAAADATERDIALVGTTNLLSPAT